MENTIMSTFSKIMGFLGYYKANTNKGAVNDDNYDDINTLDDSITNGLDDSLEMSGYNYVAKVSYNILNDGSVDIEFLHDKKQCNNIKYIAMMGELLFNINNGVYVKQTSEALLQTPSSPEEYNFISQILFAWESITERVHNTPIVKPSDVMKTNMMYSPSQTEDET